MYRGWFLVCVGALIAVSGCAFRASPARVDAELVRIASLPCLDQTVIDVDCPTSSGTEVPPPPKMEPGDYVYWELSLEEAILLALTNSTVFRDLGGTVLRAPATAPTLYEPSIQDTDPRNGVEAALAAFDAQLVVNGVVEKNDRPLNNFLTGGGTFELTQDLFVLESRLQKTSASGTRISISNFTEYDFNNRPANRFPSSWVTYYDLEVRQPLLQGGGVNFNRIAGPGFAGTTYNGVLVARVNTDISVAEFQLGLRDLISNVENAYWDLYFAYRVLDARRRARDAALTTWRRVHALLGSQGFEADREAQAREQYYLLEEEVEDALSGRIQDSTATNNGSSGGTFRGSTGVLVAERRLRLILGLPITEDRLIRPADQPPAMNIVFDWPTAVTEAVMQRAELKRQDQLLKLRQLELTASKNLLLPRLDAIARWRPRGFGEDLLDPSRDPSNPFASAYQSLTSGDYQEWLFGFEFSMPIGMRREYARLRHQQLQLARERAIYEEQKRQILHDLSNALNDAQRAWRNLGYSYNRLVAAKTTVLVLRNKIEQNLPVNLDQLLDAERRYTDADIRYHRAAVEYALAIKNVNFEKGSLLDYAGIGLAQGPWPGQEEARRAMLKPLRDRMSYAMDRMRWPGAQTPPPERAPPPPEGESRLPNQEEDLHRGDAAVVMASAAVPGDAAPFTVQAVHRAPHADAGDSILSCEQAIAVLSADASPECQGEPDSILIPELRSHGKLPEANPAAPPAAEIRFLQPPLDPSLGAIHIPAGTVDDSDN